MSNRTIKIICSWCNRYIREENGRNVEGISHSICTDCLNDLRPKLKNGSSAAFKQYQERSRVKRARMAST
jgi:hypothetical protein